MNATRTGPPDAHAARLGRPRAFEAIAYGGLSVGALDGLAAPVSSALRGVGPVRVFQYVASGLLGPASFGGGRATSLLGVLIIRCVVDSP
jgi:hypothetical protein